MENTKVNVRGTLNALEINEQITFPRKVYLVSSIRTIASLLSGDFGKKFNVSAKDDNNIVVTRLK